MGKYLKLIEWILGGIITIFFLYGPGWFYNHNPYSDPYKVPLMLVAIFLIYCFSLGIYWMINKNIKMACHYGLIIITYIVVNIAILVFVAYKG